MRIGDKIVILTEAQKEELMSLEAYPDTIKICTICDGEFTTNRKNKNICSWDCRREHNRRHSRLYARLKRYGTVNGEKIRAYTPCIICGFYETTDQHEEGGKKYTLCPNHHCMITRNLTTLDKLLVEKKLKNK